MKPVLVMGSEAVPRENRTHYDSNSLVIRNGHISLLNWETEDPDIVSYFENKPPVDRLTAFNRVVKIGVEALKAAGTTERIDYVEKEFASLQTRFGTQLEKTLTQLQSKFEEVFGDRGKVSKLLDETFGEKGKIVKEIFDPRKDGSPLNQIRTEFLNSVAQLREDLVVSRKVGQVEEKTTIKGFQFEDEMERLLNRIVTQHKGDRIERSSTSPGMLGHSKKGDFVMRIRDCPDLLIAIDTKNVARISSAEIERTLDEAIKTRGAAYAILISKSVNALPEPVGWFNEYGDQRLVCAVGDSTSDEIREEILNIAISWAKMRLGLQKARMLNDDPSIIENAVVTAALALNRFKDVLTQCTNLENATNQIRILCGEINREVMEQLRTIMPTPRKTP